MDPPESRFSKIFRRKFRKNTKMPAPAGFTGTPFMGRSGLQVTRSARLKVVFACFLVVMRFAQGLIVWCRR